MNKTETPSGWSIIEELKKPRYSLATLGIAGAVAIATGTLPAYAQEAPAASKKPNILVIWGDDIGMWDLSCYHRGIMGNRTPNIDRIAAEGAIFTDYYGQQSSTAGRAAFITGQHAFRIGLLKVGLPGAELGLQPEDPTIADLLKNHGYTTGQFGKNHLGDRNMFLPTVHGFDEFFGNLYHLNAEEEPEDPQYPKMPEFKQRFGPRGALLCKDKLMKGYSANGKPFKVHHDGYDQRQLLAGTGPSARNEIFYFDDNGNLNAVRLRDWKAHFALPGDWFQGGDPVLQSFPKIVNLRMDPLEDHVLLTESPMAARWMTDKFWAFVPMQAVVGMFLQTFKEFPQRQKSASFNIDQVLKQMEQGSGAGK